jgi:DeoR family transcriptional regulator of aga operon
MVNNTERHQFILHKVQKEGFIQVVDLCKALKVSSVTIRKDLKLLEDKNLLFRTHGGASMNNPYAVDKPVNEKEKLQSDEKTRIAIAAAQSIEPNDSVIIASGTTVLALAKVIKPLQRLSVVTSALNVAMELLHHDNIEVIQLGGIIRRSSSSIIGAYAQDMLADFSCSKLFLGADGVDLEFGLTTTSVVEAHLNRQMIKASQKVIVLADSTKFGRRGFGRICGLEEASQIITDKGIPGHYLKQLEAMGIEVTIV